MQKNWEQSERLLHQVRALLILVLIIHRWYMVEFPPRVMRIPPQHASQLGITCSACSEVSVELAACGAGASRWHCSMGPGSGCCWSLGYISVDAYRQHTWLDLSRHIWHTTRRTIVRVYTSTGHCIKFEFPVTRPTWRITLCLVMDFDGPGCNSCCSDLLSSISKEEQTVATDVVKIFSFPLNSD